MMSCVVCDKQKNELHQKKSAILPKTNLLVCNDCLEAGLEPRYIVALAVRQRVPAAMKFLRERKYPGEEILAKEVMT